MELLDRIFIEKNQSYYIILYLHIIWNIFIWRVTYKRFSARLFEKLGNSFLFLSGIVFILIYISYYLPFFDSILMVILLLLYTCEIIYYFEYNSFFTSKVFIVLKETNFRESKEFLNDLLSLKLLKSMLFIFSSSLLFPIFIFKILDNYLAKFNHKYFFFYILISIIYSLQAFFSKNTHKYFRYLPYFRILKEYLEAKKELKENAMALKIQFEREKEIENLNSERDIDTFILVIGESASRNYIELYNSYGSYLKNSPYMKKRKEQEELFLFDNVISPESLTVLAIPKIMTFKNYETTKEWYYFKNVISLLKKSGYVTYWLSNHGKNEVIEKVCSSIADNSFFAEDFTNQEENYDESLLEEGIKIIGNEKKKVIFFHLQGSHNTYKKRYPPEWNLDNETNIKGNFTYKKKKYIAEYSNSLRYTDYILEKIYTKFEKEKTALLYISDHAEELWEDRDVRGHSDNGSKYMIEIPMFMLFSKSFQEKYPELIENCKKAKNKPYMTDDIIHTILGIVGINEDEYDNKRDILSEKFDTSRKRIYQGKDYDTFWRLEHKEKNIEKN